MCQSMKTEKFYRNHLWKYFDKHFKEYEDTVEYFVDPALNQWKFMIPELDQTILLVCEDSGKVRKTVL